MTQRNTPDALAWLRHESEANHLAWRAMCQKLARSARNLPGVFPSAFAQIQGTPMSDRIHDVDKMQAGMVVMFDDPHDSNPFAHIATLRTRQKGGGLWLTWTNDALRRGGVNCVDIEWFKRHWGDPLVFASKSINGFDLELPRAMPRKNPAPKPGKVATTGNLDYAIHRLEKSLAYHRTHKHPRYVKALTAEIKAIEKIKKGKV